MFSLAECCMDGFSIFSLKSKAWRLICHILIFFGGKTCICQLEWWFFIRNVTVPETFGAKMQALRELRETGIQSHTERTLTVNCYSKCKWFQNAFLIEGVFTGLQPYRSSTYPIAAELRAQFGHCTFSSCKIRIYVLGSLSPFLPT